MGKRYYITTPIYYVNATPHAGHALTMMVCDVTKRYRQLRGHEVVFLTGTDENGLKIKEAAEAAGEDPIAFVDRISQTFVELARELNVDYDIFYRTTSPRHTEVVQEMYRRMEANGYIYQDTYEGWYDVSAETFFREADLVDGKSPEGNEVRWVSEANYFFALSKFGDRLLEHIEANPEFLLPEGRRNEVVSFIKSGLRDMCITRNNPGWGVPVPGDDSKVIYVWFDALINYLAGSGWPDEGWENLWPADIHWMAKEIFTRFHATLWPAMLMAADLPLPKTVIAHGWFMFDGGKMSKSKGNIIATGDIIKHFEEVGCDHDLAVDATRWSLIRAMPYEHDSHFGQEVIERNYNVDLANDLGNALNRSLTMAHKFAGGVMPDAPVEAEVQEAIDKARADLADAFDRHRLDDATDAAMSLVRFLNKYIDSAAPWALAKAGDDRLHSVMASILTGLRNCEILVRPFLPAAADRMAAQLNLAPGTGWDDASIPAGTQLNQPVPMFPRVQIEKAKPAEAAPAKPKKEKKSKARGLPEPAPEIEIDEFFRLNLRVSRILEAERVEGSDKLMKMQVRVSGETRQIIAGIAKQYAPEDLIGRQVIVVANLKPAKLMGLDSEGMIMAADDPDGGAILLEPDKEAPEGSRVH